MEIQGGTTPFAPMSPWVVPTGLASCRSLREQLVKHLQLHRRRRVGDHANLALPGNLELDVGATGTFQQQPGEVEEMLTFSPENQHVPACEVWPMGIPACLVQRLTG